jgi:hypothetical protein
MAGGVPGRSRPGGGPPPRVRGGRRAPGSAPRRAGTGPAAAAGWCRPRRRGSGPSGAAGAASTRCAREIARRLAGTTAAPARWPGPGRGRRRRGLAGGPQEDRPGGPAGQRAGEELGRPGPPDHPLDRATLAVSPGPPVGQVQVFHVQGQQLIRAGGGLIRQPPRVRSRSGRSRRANSRSSWPRVRARVWSTWSRRRSRSAVGSPASQPRPRLQPTAARRVASSRFPVAGAAVAWRSRNHPATLGPDSSPTGVAGPSSATKPASEAGRPAGWSGRGRGGPRRRRRRPGA